MNMPFFNQLLQCWCECNGNETTLYINFDYHLHALASMVEISLLEKTHGIKPIHNIKF
jgi:hypothetical protein